jgi:hypothetical protein
MSSRISAKLPSANDRLSCAPAAKQSVGMLARHASYVKLKPHAFGVAIDLKAILCGIAERRSGKRFRLR